MQKPWPVNYVALLTGTLDKTVSSWCDIAGVTQAKSLAVMPWCLRIANPAQDPTSGVARTGRFNILAARFFLGGESFVAPNSQRSWERPVKFGEERDLLFQRGFLVFRSVAFFRN